MAATLLTSCGSDTDAPGAHAPEREAVVTAGIGQAGSSRAAESSWLLGDRIGISGTSGSRVYANRPYSTADGSGTFVPEASGSIFIQDKTTARFTAYHPFTGADGSMPASIAGNTRADMQTASAQPAIDWLWAETTADYTDPRLDFSFTHRMSRLTLTFVSGEGADVASITGYTLGGLASEGSFDPSAGTARATGQPEALAIKDLNVASGKALPSLILYPQTPAGDVTVSTLLDGSTYTCSLPLPELAAGNDYRFTVTVAKTGLTVSRSTITPWADGGSFDGDANMPGIAPEVGDFYYSDGTYSSVLDASRPVIGIVFYVGRHPNDQSDYTRPLTENGTTIPDGKVHGYVVALHDASEGDCMWGEPNIELGCYQKDADGKPICNTIGSAGNPQIEWGGYEWTRKIIAAAGGADKLNATTQAGYPATYYAVVAYQSRVAAPTGSSGWFLPSIGQMLGTGSQNGNIISAGGSGLQDMYQTSSEKYDEPRRYVLHAFLKKVWSQNYTKGYINGPARAILAF